MGQLELIAMYIAAFSAFVGAIITALNYRRNKRKKKDIVSFKHNIPQHDSIFVGRKEEIKKIIENLKSRLFLIEITAIGGIGKTALAIEVANRCIKKKFFHDVIWISARYEPIDIDRLLKEIITFEYGLTGKELPIQEGKAVAKNILASSQVLVVIDNYEDVTDERVGTFLKEIPEPSKVLITTRHLRIKEATTIKIEGLPEKDCIELAKNEINRHQIKSFTITDRELSELSKATFGIPFLIKWAVGQIKLGYDLRNLLYNIKTLNVPEEIYDYIFKKSFVTLNKNKTSIDILLVCSLSKNPLSIEDIIGIVDPAERDIIKNCIELLISQNLIEVEKNLRNSKYKIHPLTRKYVHYYTIKDVQYNEDYSKFYNYFYDEIVKSSSKESPYYNFIEENFYTVLSVIDYFIQKKVWNRALILQQALSRYFWVRGYWKLRIKYGKIMLESAQLMMDEETKARILMDSLGWTTYALYKDTQTAKEYIENSKNIFDKSKSYYGMVKSRRHLASISRSSGNFTVAENFYNEALEMIKHIKDENQRKEMKAGLYLSIGKLYVAKENYSSALTYFDKSLECFREINDELRILKVLNVKAKTLIFLDKLDDAIDFFEKVIQYSNKLQRLDQIPIALESLYECYTKKEKRKSARKYLEEAIKAYEALGDTRTAEKLKIKLRGEK